MQAAGSSSISAQIGRAFAVVLMGLLAVIGAGVLGLREVERNITELVSVSTLKSDLSSSLQLAIVQRVDVVRNIALTPEVNAMQADIRRVDTLVKSYTASRAKLMDLGLSPAEREALAKADVADASAAPLLKQA